MIVKEWSNEIGSRLEKITGIESWYFKECFDYKNKILPDELKYFIVEDDFILPLVEVIDRYTKKRMPIVLTDACLNQADLFLNQDSYAFERNNLKIIPNARQDYIVNLMDNFTEHRKSLQRIGRCYNKCEDNFETIVHKGMYLQEEHRELCDMYSNYWVNKGEEYFYYDMFLHFIKQVERVSETFTIEIKKNDKTLALAFFELVNNAIYWHETVRTLDVNYEKFSIGNYVLLKALEDLCYELRLPLNLGVSWFDYKLHWHPSVKEVRGLSFIKE